MIGFIKDNWLSILAVIGGVISLFFLPCIAGITLIFFGLVHFVSRHLSVV